MAVYRPTPTCKHCGKAIAKGIYRDESDLPRILRTIGDTFIKWDYTQCSCKEAREERKRLKKNAIKLDIRELTNKSVQDETDRSNI